MYIHVIKSQPAKEPKSFTAETRYKALAQQDALLSTVSRVSAAEVY